MNALTRLIPFKSSSWDPFSDIAAVENRLEQFFGRPVNTQNGGKESMTVAQWAPAVDITEDDKEYVIKAELPEMKKEDVKVTVENGELTITGERKVEKEEKNKKYHRVEGSYGTFLRAFTLPEGVTGDQIAASFKDGVLSVHLPKGEKAKPQTIAVSAG